MQNASVHSTEQILFFTLLQLVVIVLAGRIGGAVARRFGQSISVGEIIVGIVLGPSLFGAVTPELFAHVFRSTPALPLTLLSQIGLLLLMFQIGLEFDFEHLSERSNRKAMLLVAAAGLAFPFALGLGFAQWVPAAYGSSLQPQAFELFFAVAMSITALPILGRIMMEFSLTRTALGVIAIGAAAVNDVVGWLALALVSALAASSFDGAAFGMRVIGVLAFFAVCWWAVRPLLGRWVDQEMTTHGGMSPLLMGVVLACVFGAGMATYQLGIFAIFGGFMCGVLLHDRVSFVMAWKDRVGHFVNVFFLPIFFTYTGLRTDIGSLSDAHAWAWCVGVIGVAMLSKFGGCYLAARLAGLAPTESSVLGIMMNTRALMELVVINVGYDMGVIGRPMFTMLVLMAIVSTLITTPVLRRLLPRLGLWSPNADLSLARAAARAA